MYERILVAIDGSDTSDLALREAIGLAKDQNAMLRLVRVVDGTPPAYIADDAASAGAALHFPLAEYQKTLQEAGENLLRTRATTASEAGVRVDTKLITVGLGERIYEAIEEQSKQWPANLIVVGTEGRRGFQRLMIGSVAEGPGPHLKQTSAPHSR